MKEYIGVKLIEAEPMKLGEYNKFKGWTITENEDPNKDGYLVKYNDDYISWSPKDVFEKAYCEVKQLDVNKKNLLTHQSRVQDEAYELSAKLTGLKEFILNNPIFAKLETKEQIRLNQQLLAMEYYLTILVERIRNF